MKTMSFEDFKNEVTDSLFDYLPESFEGARVKIEKVKKPDYEYEGMTVRKEGENVNPVADLNRMYRLYENGAPFDGIMEAIARIFTQPLPTAITPDMTWLLDFDKAKEKLFVRVHNVKGKEEFIKTVPHRQYGSIFVTCNVLVSRDEKGVACMTVTNDVLEAYGITEEELFEEAEKNSPNLFTPVVKKLTEALGLPDWGEDVPLIVTNDKNVHGASTIFYEGMFDRLSERLGGSFIVLPSSTEEMLVVPDDKDYDAMREMVRMVNEESVEENMRLSDNVYRYDAETKQFAEV